LKEATVEKIKADKAKKEEERIENNLEKIDDLREKKEEDDKEA